MYILIYFSVHRNVNGVCALQRQTVLIDEIDVRWITVRRGSPKRRSEMGWFGSCTGFVM